MFGEICLYLECMIEMNDNLLYEAPAVEIVPVRSEGIICGSGGTEDYNKNSPLNW